MHVIPCSRPSNYLVSVSLSSSLLHVVKCDCKRLSRTPVTSTSMTILTSHGPSSIWPFRFWSLNPDRRVSNPVTNPIYSFKNRRANCSLLSKNAPKVSIADAEFCTRWHVARFLTNQEGYKLKMEVIVDLMTEWRWIKITLDTIWDWWRIVNSNIWISK